MVNLQDDCGKLGSRCPVLAGSRLLLRVDKAQDRALIVLTVNPGAQLF